jgi:Na+-driven multidrug efflux pump
MRHDLKSSFFKRLNLNESWIIFFVLGIIMMNYPFINIFNKPTQLFGIPVFYLYMYLGWLVSILVIYLFVKAIDHEENNKGDHR